MKKTALVLAAAAALGTLGFSAGTQAMPIGSGAPTVEKQTEANIETVSHRRYWRGHRHGRWHRHHHDDGWRYGGAFLGGVLIGSALNDAYDDGYYYDDPPPRRYRYRVADDHVAYCLDRYRSYDVRTDTFRGYDGYRHRCNSPYD
jgi:hypothetical protein